MLWTASAYLRGVRKWASENCADANCARTISREENCARVARGAREVLRQAAARLRGLHLVVGDEEDALQPRRDIHALRHPLPRARRPERHLEAAVDGGRDVVGVALLVGGELQQQLLRRRRRQVLAAEGEAGGEARDEGGRGAPHPARRRHRVLALEVQRHHRLPHRRQALLDALDDQVVGRGLYPVGALALDGHRELVGARHDQPVVHVHRQPERVEARAHVGGRRRHVHVHAVDGLVERLLDRLDPRGRVGVGLVGGRGERPRRAAHERRGRASEDRSTHGCGVISDAAQIRFCELALRVVSEIASTVGRSPRRPPLRRCAAGTPSRGLRQFTFHRR